MASTGGALAGYVYIIAERRKLPFWRFFRRMRDAWAARTERQDGEPPQPYGGGKTYDIRDAQFHEKSNDEGVTQRRIDEILDKISTGGYQSLTEEEKKILFDASKKMN